VALKAGQFRGEGSATAWLYGIARNLLRESLRRGRIEAGARRSLLANRARGSRGLRPAGAFFVAARRIGQALGGRNRPECLMDFLNPSELRSPDTDSHPIRQSRRARPKIVVSPVRVRVSPSEMPPWMLLGLVFGECRGASDRRLNLGLNWA
jgi:hypothetical protein